MKLSVFLFAAAILLLSQSSSSSAATKCDVEAVFNFGDSNSDTGGAFAAFPQQYPPYGATYFQKPTGRMSDGRLIIDFLAQALGLPLLSPYLKSIDSDFRHGANFAAISAGVCLDSSKGGSPFSLPIQLNQFKVFKRKVDERNSSGTPLPEPDIFAKSLFTLYIGQNDFTFSWPNPFGLPGFLQKVVLSLVNSTEEIYNLGGRTILVFNVAPMGCYPYLLSKSHNASDIDSFGCLISCNKAVEEFNCMLKAELERARQELPDDAKLILVDTHSVLLQIFTNPSAYGFEKATVACFNGTVCEDPQKYVNWDGIHLTEAANKIVAETLLNNGSYFDPPFSFN